MLNKWAQMGWTVMASPQNELAPRVSSWRASVLMQFSRMVRALKASSPMVWTEMKWNRMVSA